MGTWKDGETFSENLLRAARLTTEYHLEAIDGLEHDCRACALNTVGHWARQCIVMANTIGEQGAPEEMPDVYKTLFGGQLVTLLIDIVAMLEMLSPNPDATMTASLESINEYAIMRIDELVKKKQDMVFERNRFSVVAEAERFLRGRE